MLNRLECSIRGHFHLDLDILFCNGSNAIPNHGNAHEWTNENKKCAQNFAQIKLSIEQSSSSWKKNNDTKIKRINKWMNALTHNDKIEKRNKTNGREKGWKAFRNLPDCIPMQPHCAPHADENSDCTCFYWRCSAWISDNRRSVYP